MSQFECGQKSSLGQYLHYKFQKNTADALADHQYSKTPLYDLNLIAEENEKKNRIDTVITQKLR